MRLSVSVVSGQLRKQSNSQLVASLCVRLAQAPFLPIQYAPPSSGARSLCQGAVSTVPLWRASSHPLPEAAATPAVGPQINNLASISNAVRTQETAVAAAVAALSVKAAGDGDSRFLSAGHQCPVLASVESCVSQLVKLLCSPLLDLVALTLRYQIEHATMASGLSNASVPFYITDSCSLLHH